MSNDPSRVIAKYLFGLAALLSVFGSLNPPTPKPQTPTPVVITPTPQAPVAMVATPPVQVVEAPQVVVVVATPTPTPIEVARPTTAPPKVVATPAPVVVSGTHEDWMRAAGIAESDFGCATEIISRESGFNVHATNPTSGAYGIAQALPASKLASAGSDWRDNPITQLRWMQSYVSARYGGFCPAWAWWQSHHWY